MSFNVSVCMDSAKKESIVSRILFQPEIKDERAENRRLLLHSLNNKRHFDGRSLAEAGKLQVADFLLHEYKYVSWCVIKIQLLDLSQIADKVTSMLLAS